MVNWLKYGIYLTAAGFVGVLPLTSQGQTRSGPVIVTARVSGTVALSASAPSPHQNVRIDGNSDSKALTLTVSGAGPDVVTVRVPILIRSNTGYSLSALVQSQAATLANFAVLDVRPTGKQVAAEAVGLLKVVRELDRRAVNGTIQTSSFPLNLAGPLTILSGPRVSLAGTLNSADNALEVTLLITMKPDAGADRWWLHLSLSGSVSDRF